jgi:hypothetical protein
MGEHRLAFHAADRMDDAGACSQGICRRFPPGGRLAKVLHMTSESRKSVYEPLRQRLLRERVQCLQLTFSEIEDILDRKLPRSAPTFSARWSNESSA